jgi:hypothetical protein
LEAIEMEDEDEAVEREEEDEEAEDAEGKISGNHGAYRVCVLYRVENIAIMPT